MFVKNVYTFRNLPVEEKERRWTDCFCTIVGAIFALTLFIMACCMFSRDHFLDTNFPVESTGKMCYRQLNDAPYMFLQNALDSTKNRYCVAACPQAGQQIQCSKQTNCAGITSTYSSAENIDNLGGFCVPTDPALQKQFWDEPFVKKKLSKANTYHTMLICLLIGFLVGLIYLIIFIVIPPVMVHLAFVLAALATLAAGIVFIVQPIKFFSTTGSGWAIVVGIIFILIAICLIFFLLYHTQELQIAAIFLSYANVFLKQNYYLFAYIIAFLFCSFGLVVLCMWQFVAFGSFGAPTWTSNQIFKRIDQSFVLQAFNLIEFLWGIQFIRDTANYIISGNAVEWYFTYNSDTKPQCSRPVTRYFCKNFGSVAGGAFVNAFFSFLSFIYNIFRCHPKRTCGGAAKCCRGICCCCNWIFDLVRSDAYAYIHLSGIPYCNAARQCQAICESTHLFNSDHNCIGLYRFAAQLFVTIFAVLMGFAVLSSTVNYLNLFFLFMILFNCYLMAVHFVDIHANAAQGLVTSYLAENNCEGNMLEVCPHELRTDVYNFEQKYELIAE